MHGGIRDWRERVGRAPCHRRNAIGEGVLGLNRAAIGAFTALGVVVFVDVVLAVICLLKGKLWTGFFGLFVPIVAWVGAFRLARPGSPWAHRRYLDRPKKLARARRREQHIDRTWRAWREAFFDLIAGKPHLPSVSAVSALEPASSAASTEATDTSSQPAPKPMTGTADRAD